MRVACITVILLAACAGVVSAAGKTCTRHIKEYGQCGGGCTWEGAKKTCVGVFEGACCPAGWQCHKNDEFYFNCLPGRSAAQSSRFHSEANAANAAGAGANDAGTLNFKPAPPVPAKMTAAGDYDYSVPLGLSFLFYEAQRAGKLNPKSNRIKWRGDAGAADRAPDGRDVSKGWFDAGDNVKFNLPMAWSIGVLAWSVFEFKDGYKAAGQYDEALDNIRWATDYLINCVGDGSSIVVQVGNGQADHAGWNRPEDAEGKKPVYVVTPDAPGSDVVGSMASALAASSVVFADVDPAYSARLLEAAIKAYRFATRYLGKYSDAVPDAAQFYKSSNFYDDLSFAACWLAARTGGAAYKADAVKYYALHMRSEQEPPVWNNYDWDSASWGAAVLLTRLVPSYALPRERLNGFVREWLDPQPKGLVSYTPKGLAFSGEWGSLRHLGSALFLMQAYSRSAGSASLSRSVDCFTHAQLRYVLGAAGRSFVVGYGINPPVRPHHRGASCPPMPDACSWDAYNNPGANWQTLYGAVVGGPDATDGYEDNRANFVQNEVATDYNAGFTGALASMVKAPVTWKQCGGKWEL